jgi:hypothetical protein
MTSTEAVELAEILTAYYTAHAPDKLRNVGALVARVYGGPPSDIGSGVR